MARVGDRIEIIEGERDGRTGQVIEVHPDDSITVRLDDPDISPHIPGISPTDMVRLAPDQFRSIG